jgi:hypothetical protein
MAASCTLAALSLSSFASCCSGLVLSCVGLVLADAQAELAVDALRSSLQDCSGSEKVPLLPACFHTALSTAVACLTAPAASMAAAASGQPWGAALLRPMQ